MRQQLVISTAGSNTIPPYVKHSPKQGTSNDSVTSPLVKPPSSSSTWANLDLTLRVPFRPIKDKKTQESLARIIFSSLFFILFTMTCSHARSHARSLAHSHAHSHAHEYGCASARAWGRFFFMPGLSSFFSKKMEPFLIVSSSYKNR